MRQKKDGKNLHKTKWARPTGLAQKQTINAKTNTKNIIKTTPKQIRIKRNNSHFQTHKITTTNETKHTPKHKKTNTPPFHNTHQVKAIQKNSH